MKRNIRYVFCFVAFIIACGCGLNYTNKGVATTFVLLPAPVASLIAWRYAVDKKKLAERQIKFANQKIIQLEQEKQLVATQSVLDGETRERARLARDLHDSLGSMLTGVKLNLLEMKQGAKLEYTDVERFNRALGLLDKSVQEMRRVAHHLMPDSLSRFGLKPAVNDFCNNLPSVQFMYYGDDSRIEPNLEVMIYRTIHELVNNALKHAGAEQIMVQILREDERIAFTVQDDGCGFDPDTITQGMGLENIRNRVAAYNGIINIDSSADEGTEINVELKVVAVTNYELQVTSFETGLLRRLG
jgi:signal transduction histidine kinase